jgi:DNA-dependent RNA polymerase auxiliary subunit epsilon
MDVFVIHSGDDRTVVSEKLTELRREAHCFNPLLLKSGNAAKKDKKTEKIIKEKQNGTEHKKKHRLEIPFWKIDARKKIKKANFIIFFVGKNSHSSKYIDWEIRTAIKLSKPIYAVKLNNQNELNASIHTVDSFSGEKKPYCEFISFDDLQRRIKEYEKGSYKVFNQSVENIDKPLLLEQYKLFLQTSEDLVSRRQNVNNFYISINSALMAAFGIILALNIQPLYKSIAGVLLAAVGIILSISWIKLLASYGDLNSSKMKIISYIERQLPASLYDAEWAALSDKLNKRKYVSFTNSEKRVPILFIVVYICVSLGVIAFLF